MAESLARMLTGGAPAVAEMFERFGVDVVAGCRAVCLGWDEIERVAADPLATIAAHTASHPVLARLDAAEAERELAAGRDRIAEVTGARPMHLAYPHGGPDAAGTREFAMAARLGFRSAVTTRPGLLFAEHRRHMTALPRISVSGRFQRLRYLEVLLGGAPTAMLNGFRRVNAA